MSLHARPLALFSLLILLSIPNETGPLFAGELEPAFRLPSGGLPLAGPLVDAKLSPAVAWLLSEDLSLYALGENGNLIARIPLAFRPLPYMAIDPFGRVLVADSGVGLGRGFALIAYTRSGTESWRIPLPAAPDFPPAFGADGRLFLAVGSSFLCLSPSGFCLWRLDLSSKAAAAPSVDGSGRPLLALEDGTILVLSPYGETMLRLRSDSAVSALSPFSALAFRKLPPKGTELAAGAADTSAAGTELTDRAGVGTELAARTAGVGTVLPIFAAGLRDGRVLVFGPWGERVTEIRFDSAISGLASDGTLLYGLTESGFVFACAGDGSLLWKTETVIAGGRLWLFEERLIVTSPGRVVSLSLEGETTREARFAHAAAAGAPSPAGLLFSPGDDWVLAAYRFERPLGMRNSTKIPPYGLDEVLLATLRVYDPGLSDPTRQLAFIAEIEKKLAAGAIGLAESSAATITSAIALGSFPADLPQYWLRYPVSPLPRARAAALLGRLGSPEYLDTLIQVFSRDADPAVRAAACEALADIAVDPEGRVGAAFLRAVDDEARPLDERAALALISAVERMAIHSGMPPQVETVRALLALATKPYSAGVRGRASRAIGRIAGTLQ